jgi:hypothetical protein
MVIILGVQAQKGRHAERLAMIEKGVVLEERRNKRTVIMPSEMFGDGWISFGLIIDCLSTHTFPIMEKFFFRIPAFTILFGELGSLFISFFLVKHRKKKIIKTELQR